VSPGSGGEQPHLFFDPVGNVTAWWGDPVGVSSSADGGATWSAAATPPGFPDVLGVAGDAQGGRVFAWPAGSGIRVMRTGPTGLPVGNAYATIALGPVSANDVSVAVNRSGDALIAYTTLQGGSFSNGQGGASFWPAGQPAPNPGQWIASSTSSSFAPNAILDDDRYAVAVWQSDQTVVQSVAANANGANPFGPPTTVGSGGGPKTAQAFGGRAVLSWQENLPVPAPDPGFGSNYTRLLGATRAPGQPFGAGAVIGGDAKDFVVVAPGSVAIAPTGRFVIGFATVVNRTGGLQCKDIRGNWRARASTGTIDANGMTQFASSVVGGGGTVNAFQPYVAAGPDGRLIASWNQNEDCGPADNGANPTQRPGVAFAPPDGPFAPTPQPPGWVGALGFRTDGTAYAIAGSVPVLDSNLFGVPYDTGVPFISPAAPAPSPAVIPTPPTPPGTTVGVSPPKFISARPQAGGTLKLTFTSDPGDLSFIVYAKATGLVAKSPAKRVKVASAKVKVRKRGRVTVVLRATGRGARTLKRRGRLAGTLQTTFKPASGGKATVTTRAVTFRRSAVRRR
jgi:hypothetical protein